MKAINTLTLIILLASCKKEEIKQTQLEPQPVVQKLFSYEGKNIISKVIKKNEVELTPPFNVIPGDVVYVLFKVNPLVGEQNKLQLSILLDGKELGGCSSCFQYENTFNIN